MYVCSCVAMKDVVRKKKKKKKKARQMWGGKAIISKIATVIGEVRPEASL